MSKYTVNNIILEKGEMNIYNFKDINLYAYKTNDFIDNEVFIVEKNGKAVIIESPCFFDNNQELKQYIDNLKLDVSGMLLSYHMAGGTFLPDVKKYATKNADEYGHDGGGKALIDNFVSAFGQVFDKSIHTITDYINEDIVVIAGIEFVIKKTQDAFDIEIPEINTVYTHMLGHDCHSIIAGQEHANAVIETLKEYLKNGYDIILTSHYTPEDLKDVKTKIAYLEDIKVIAAKSNSAEEFKNTVKEKYNQYSGENYLDITASFFFNK